MPNNDNNSPRSMPFICKPISLEFIAQLPPYLTLPHQANISPALNHPGATTRQLEATTIAQSPLEVLKLASPKLFAVPSLALPWKP